MIRISEHIVPMEMEPPPRLYHYTSQLGLLGILSSRTMWCTRIHYLNDSTEFAYALGLLKNAIQLRRHRVEATKQQMNLTKQHMNLTKQQMNLTPVFDVFDAMSKGIESLSRIHVHVACFSEDGDALSQWRGYCRTGSGFSVGFDSSQLVNAADRQSCFIAPCVYDPQRQSQLVDQLMRGFFEEALTKAGRVADDFFLDCVFLACVLKHPSFKEEREWRIVTQELSDAHPQVAVRQGKVVLVPHFGFELVQPEEQLNVEIVVGPNPEMNLAMDSLTTLFRVHNCLGSSRASVVPYREL